MTTALRPATRGLNWPLMRNNISRADLDAVIALLEQDDPILTQSSEVRAFEREWSDWLGVRHSVFVNSGSSANLLTMAALREVYGEGEVIVPALSWVSDIASVIHNRLEPVFVDIDPRTLGMDAEQTLSKLSSRTRAVFITHAMGYNALAPRLLDELKVRNIPLIEDVCESHGATFQGRKLGTIGLMSNFSFYYAHHLTTIEGGMISTDDDCLYETVRMLRSHGMVRELSRPELKDWYHDQHPDLNPEFLFAFPGYNVRSTEINAVLGRSQLRRLDQNNEVRSKNLSLFLANLDPEKYQTDFAVEGSCNYAFTLVLKHADPVLCQQVRELLQSLGVEFRRGTAGGGNQLRQPYVRRFLGRDDSHLFPCVDHVHFYGFYIGNYPDLPKESIETLCSQLNALPGQPT